MKKTVCISAVVLLVILLVIWLEPTRVLIGRLQGDAFFQGRPSRYWAGQLMSEDPPEALGDSSGKSTAVLRQLLVTSGDDERATTLRWTAADLLGKIGPAAQQASEDLIRALDDPDPHVRGVAAASLPAVERRADVVVPWLIELLSTEQRTVAARALSQYGEQADSALPELVRILRDTTLDTEARWNAARTIGKMRAHGAPAIAALTDSLKDAASTVREHAAEALGDIGPPSAPTVPALVAMFQDPAPRVRRDAARSLGQIGVADAAAVEALKGLLADSEAIVRDAAKTALKLLTGEEFETVTPEPPKAEKAGDGAAREAAADRAPAGSTVPENTGDSPP
jgi:HEAT repeat protein